MPVQVHSIQKIKAVQPNDCTAFMVGATGPDRLASLAVSGNNFMSLLLRFATQKMDYAVQVQPFSKDKSSTVK